MQFAQYDFSMQLHEKLIWSEVEAGCFSYTNYKHNKT